MSLLGVIFNISLWTARPLRNKNCLANRVEEACALNFGPITKSTNLTTFISLFQWKTLLHDFYCIVQFSSQGIQETDTFVKKERNNNNNSNKCSHWCIPGICLSFNAQRISCCTLHPNSPKQWHYCWFISVRASLSYVSSPKFYCKWNIHVLDVAILYCFGHAPTLQTSFNVLYSVKHNAKIESEVQYTTYGYNIY